MRSGPPAGCGWVSGYAGQRHYRADHGLGLGQALLLAAAVVEVMGLLVAIERTAAIALESSKSLNFKARNNQELPLP